MPGPFGKSTWHPWRRWASKLDEIVTDNGATIDFFGGPIDDPNMDPTILSGMELLEVNDDDVIGLLTPAVERIKVMACGNLTDASIEAVAA